MRFQKQGKMEELRKMANYWDKYEDAPPSINEKNYWDRFENAPDNNMLNIDVPYGTKQKQKPLDPAIEYLSNAIQKHPFLNNLVNSSANHPVANFINEKGNQAGGYTNPLVGGALQEIGDVGASVGNFALKGINPILGENYNIPHPELKQYLEPGLYTDAAFLGGQLGAGLVGLGGLGTGRGAIQALQHLPRPSGWSGLATDILKGAGGGYVTGENAEGDRTAGTILGGIAQPISSITNRGITNRVLGDRAREEARHAEMYGDIFGPALENNIPLRGDHFLNTREPIQQIFHNLRGRLGRDYRDVIDNFLTDPTIESGQRLQSSLGTFARNIEKTKAWKTNSLPPGRQRAYDSATELRNALQRDIEGSLRRGGLPEEAALYNQTTRSFAQNVAPYRTPAISDVLEGVKHPDKLAKRLREDEKFMIELGHRYPELGLNKALPWATGIGSTAALGALGLTGFPKISHAKEKKASK